MVEPACLTHSTYYTKDDQPERLLKKIKEYAADLTGKTQDNRPKCFPVGASLPGVHNPTIWYNVDGYVTSTSEEQTVQGERMRGVKAIYTRGEGFTVKTDAERTNYLLLSWFLKANNQAAFTKPNAIMFEFAGSAMMAIIRVIEAEQNRPECGWGIHCKDSGSCWADTLLGDKDMCIPEATVVQKLRDHADGKEDTTRWVVYFTICLCTCLLLVFFCQCIGWLWKVMNPKKPKGAEEAEALAAAQEAEAKNAETAEESKDAEKEDEKP